MSLEIPAAVFGVVPTDEIVAVLLVSLSYFPPYLTPKQNLLYAAKDNQVKSL